MTPAPIVVTGVGVLSPLGRDVDEFWANLLAGVSAVSLASAGELAGVLGAYAGRIPDEWLPTGGDASPDRNTTLAIVAATEALRRARLDREAVQRARTGVVLGKCQATRGAEPGSYRAFHETCDNVADHLNLTGPRVVISTACAAGANAVGMGLDLLRAGSADIVAAGGVDILMRETFAGFSSLKAISPTPTSPYSRSDGLSLGEGAAFLILETLAHAQERGAPLLAAVAGYGLSADAYHATSPDPSGRGAISAVRRAIRHARLKVEDVSYVNGHGTGTPANDQMERRVMRSLFGDSVRQIPISSTKSAIGHTLGAAGAIEAAVCVLAIQRGMLPPTVNVTQPPPDDLDIVPHVGRPARIEVAVSSSYAFGGNNCSVVLAKVQPNHAPASEVRSRRLVITGLGAVGGESLGIAPWHSALMAGQSSVARLRSLNGEPYGCDFGAEPYPLTGRRLAPAGLWRHMDPFARQVLAAAVGAWEDAGLPGQRGGRDEVGMVFATGYGPVRTSARLSDQTAAGDRPGALEFSNSVVNAAPGAACQALNLRGPTTTVASGGVSAIIALDIAVTLIRNGQADQMIVVAADDLCEVVLRERASRDTLARDGIIRPYAQNRSGTVLGAAAVAFVVEAADVVAQRGGRAYCDVSGVAHLGAPPTTEATAVLERVFRAVLEEARCGPADVGYCAGFGSGCEGDLDELRALDAVFGSTLMLSAPKSLTGECEAASGGINMLVAALAVSEGLIPATANLDRPAPGFAVRHVTETVHGADVRRALATAASPASTYGAALFTTVR
ncbi:MAG: 3-oxoacyl-[acyl-carrier-protein] synthase [Micromonosporaceae bacterium]|jgi:3-oxoacyl-[acyl-carrier-protein] synthase II|nr:3-oxoacyl-[acyl-carrier-protein] synthase [Micromonosporaceae bacterium]